MRHLIGFVIVASKHEKGRDSMKNLFSVYNTQKGRNNKSFSATVQY